MKFGANRFVVDRFAAHRLDRARGCGLAGVRAPRRAGGGRGPSLQPRALGDPDADRARRTSTTASTSSIGTSSSRAGSRGSTRSASRWLFEAELRYFVRAQRRRQRGRRADPQPERARVPARISQRDPAARRDALGAGPRRRRLLPARPTTRATSRRAPSSGGGFLSLVYNRARARAARVRDRHRDDAVRQLHASRGAATAPGYYLEGGAHMFFAARYSVMLGVIYRSAQDPRPAATSRRQHGRTSRRSLGYRQTFRCAGPRALDMGGLGVRMGIGDRVLTGADTAPAAPLTPRGCPSRAALDPVDDLAGPRHAAALAQHAARPSSRAALGRRGLALEPHRSRARTSASSVREPGVARASAARSGRSCGR